MPNKKLENAINSWSIQKQIGARLALFQIESRNGDIVFRKDGGKITSFSRVRSWLNSDTKKLTDNEIEVIMESQGIDIVENDELERMNTGDEEG